MATIAQIQAALAKAQAAGNAQDVAALQQAMQAQQAPTRDQLSRAFYAAKAAGNEDDARAIMGHIQQSGMTLAPMTAQQEQGAYQKQLAQDVQSMPWYQQAALGAGHGFNELKNGAQQIGDQIADKITGGNRLAQLNAQIANNAPGEDALMRSGWAQAGNVGAQIAASIPLGAGAGIAARGIGIGAKAIPFIESAIGNGALSGLDQTQGSHLANAAMGATAGALFPAAGKVVGAGARLVRNGLQYVVNPGAVADRAILQAFGPDAQTALAASMPDAVPGVVPTAAQAIGGQRAIAAERAMRAAQTGAQFVNRDVASDAARLAHLQDFAGTPETLQYLRRVRGNGMQPYEAALAGKTANAAPLLDALARTRLTAAGQDPVARRALGAIQSAIMDGSDAGENVPLSVIEGQRANLGGTIRAAANDAGLGSARANVALAPIKGALLDTLRAQVPDVDQYIANYAQLSRPINTQEMLQEFLNPDYLNSVNAEGLPGLTTAKTTTLLKKIDNDEFGVSPQARQAVQDVHDSLLRAGKSNLKVGPSGSNTNADMGRRVLGWFHGASPYNAAPGRASLGVGGTLGGLIGWHVGHPIVGAELGASALGALDTMARQRVVPLIGERAANAPAALAAIQRATQPGLLSRMAPLSPVTPWLLPAAGATAMANQ